MIQAHSEELEGVIVERAGDKVTYRSDNVTVVLTTRDPHGSAVQQTEILLDENGNGVADPGEVTVIVRNSDDVSVRVEGEAGEKTLKGLHAAATDISRKARDMHEFKGENLKLVIKSFGKSATNLADLALKA